MKQWDALVRRLNKGKKDDAYNLAVLLSKIHNVHRGKNDKALKPEDFLKGGEKRTREEKNQNILQTFKALKEYG